MHKMKALVLKINPSRPEASKIKKAAEAIKKGKIVVFPTETVYGIGASAFNSKACSRIFKIKGRPRDNPLIVHVSDMKMAERIAVIPPNYRKAIEKIWPAPITFVVKARKNLPKAVTAGLSTVCIRMPSNKVALELIKESGPIAAPSANLSKRPSSTSGEHALGYFRQSVDIIIDSGRSSFGLESTILDLRSFMLLRPGSFTLEEIRKAFGKTPKVAEEVKGSKSSIAIAPGTKYRHYAPLTPIFLFLGKPEKLKEMLGKEEGKNTAFIGSKETAKILGNKVRYKLILGSKNDLQEIGRNLFSSLIELDKLKARFSIVESFSREGYGLAIMNRLQKASNYKTFSRQKELERLLKEV